MGNEEEEREKEKSGNPFGNKINKHQIEIKQS